MNNVKDYENTTIGARARVISAVLALQSILVGCGDDKPVFDAPVFDTAHIQAGGATTVSRYLGEPYDAPAAHLGASGREQYRAGQTIFEQVWIESAEVLALATSVDTARDGLGPLYNGDRCAGCHRSNGRGSVVGEGLFLRLSQPAAGLSRFAADPTYGEQLQQRAVPGLTIEASVRRIWTEQSESLPGDEVITLRAPGFRVSPWHWGLPGEHSAWSARLAPSLIGLGLLEAIPGSAILAEASAQAARDDGVSGTASWVVHRRTGQLRLGRFGWKALQPTVAQQTAKALQQDMGLGNEVYPESVCTALQTACLERAVGEHSDPLEVPAAVLSSLVYYVSNIAVPTPRNVSELDFQRGRLQFYRAGCAACHRPSWSTDPALGLGAQKIWPFTDLLLHDMGPGLAAPVGEGNVAGAQWRTAPLWGIGLALQVNPDTGFLHDGRARTLLEAVLWHGGEAQRASDAVRKMKPTEREALLFFLRSL